MPRIEFIKPYEVKDGSGRKHVVGEVIEVSDESAAHFISRGAAVVTDKPVGKPKADKAEDKPKGKGEK